MEKRKSGDESRQLMILDYHSGLWEALHFVRVYVTLRSIKSMNV